jgi:polysaccharide biosynthesis transport protein
MTTLPQIAMRLPRPPAAMPASVAPGAIPIGFAPQAAAHHAPQMTGADVWRVIRANLWLIILLVGFSAVTGYVTNYWLARYYPKYTVTAWVAVNPPIQLDPLKSGNPDYDIGFLTLEQKNNAQLLAQNQALYSEVLRREDSLSIRDTSWFKQFGNNTALAKKDLSDNLIVTPSADTNLIRLEMSIRNPDDGKKIMEAIVDTHIQDQETENKEIQEVRSTRLNDMKGRYETQHGELVDDLNGLETKLNMSGMGGAGQLNVKENALADLNHERMDAELQFNVGQDKLQNLEAMIGKDQDPPEIVEAVDRDPQVSRLRDLIDNLDMQATTMSDDFGPKSDQMTKIESQRDKLSKELDKAEQTVRASQRDAILSNSRQSIESAQLALTRINQEIAKLESDIGELDNEQEAYLNEKDHLNAVDAKLKDIDDQQEQIDEYTNMKDLANLEWKSHPEATDIPTFPKLPVTMTLAIAMGLCASLGIAFTRELMDTTVRSPRDISRVGNMNVLGMIPHEDDDPQSRGTRLPLVIFEAPQSMMAEQLRQVRTRLQHCASLETTRTILITSPSPDDGKSTIAANIASGLALNGRKILLVDANFRRPAVHRMFNVANDRGFGDVLNSLDVFESAIQETQVPNLYVLPSGLKPTNATELLESQLLVDFIERALEEFDHVIFDTGPLLLVSETVALAPRVDGVVTVVRARANTRGVLARMRDTLRQVKAEHLGVVLNAVRTQGGGYYRSNIREYYEYQNGHGNAA